MVRDRLKQLLFGFIHLNTVIGFLFTNGSLTVLIFISFLFLFFLGPRLLPPPLGEYLERAPEHLGEPDELWEPEAACQEVAPEGAVEQELGETLPSGREVAEVEEGKEKDAAHQEGEQHEDPIHQVCNVLLHLEMYKDNPGRHEGRAGLNEEGRPQETVAGALPGHHEGGEAEEGDQEVVQHYQGPRDQEGEEGGQGQRQLGVVLCSKDEEHAEGVVEEVGDPKDEIVVKNVEPPFQAKATLAAVDDVEAGEAGQQGEGAGGGLV